MEEKRSVLLKNSVKLPSKYWNMDVMDLDDRKEKYKQQVDVYLCEIRSNKSKLRLSLTNEHYERAAILRDKIKHQQKDFIHFLANMDLSESIQ